MTYSNQISGLSGFGLSSTSSSGSNGATRFAAGLTKGFANALSSATGTGGVDLLDGFTGNVDNLDDRDLFELQLKAQRELQKFTMITNLSKTEHDTRMAAVRNMRP